MTATVPLLLDTHALLWWLDGDERLSEASRAAIGEPDQTVFVSAVSAWKGAQAARRTAPDPAITNGGS